MKKNDNDNSRHNKKDKPLIIGLITVIIVLFTLLCLKSCNNEISNLDTKELNTEFDNKLSSDDGTDAVNIDIPILADQNINNESPNLNLYNPADNSSNLVFTFFKDDKLIYQSREILPGEIVRVDFTTILDKGSFEIKAVVAPNGGNGVSNTFTINHI